MLGAVAEYEKSALVAKLKGAGDRKSAKLGRRIEGRRVPDEVKALARKLRADGLTYARISQALFEAGHRSPSNKPYVIESIRLMVQN